MDVPVCCDIKYVRGCDVVVGVKIPHKRSSVRGHGTYGCASVAIPAPGPINFKNLMRLGGRYGNIEDSRDSIVACVSGQSALDIRRRGVTRA